MSFFSRSQEVDSLETKDSVSASIHSKKKVPLTKEQLKREIKKLNILFPEIVYKQAIYETGHLKSNIYKKNKNMFGMRLAKSRKTTAIKTKNKYAVYETWFDSLIDYKLWQDNVPNKFKQTTKLYLSYLNSVYSKTDNYSSKLRFIN